MFGHYEIIVNFHKKIVFSSQKFWLKFQNFGMDS